MANMRESYGGRSGQGLWDHRARRYDGGHSDYSRYKPYDSDAGAGSDPRRFREDPGRILGPPFGSVSYAGRGPKGYVRSDERIREDVCDRLSIDPHIDASEIEVQVTSGEVTLNGAVASRMARWHAEDLTEGATGVKHVQNNLRIRDIWRRTTEETAVASTSDRAARQVGAAEQRAGIEQLTKGVTAMRVSEAMTRDVCIAAPDQTIQEAARMMGQIDIGVLPVGEKDKLVGMITDRDIAVRAVGEGKDPSTKVRDIMSAEIKYCFEDEDTDHVSRNMGDQQLRRLPVVNRDKRLVGILSLGDVATMKGSEPAGAALKEVSKPGGKHTQAAG